jgi:putative ATP-binding cassette transporter
MGLGTFRSQLLYGLHRRGFLDHEILSVVRQVELDSLVQRIGGLDALLDWPSVLAAGEQQRVAFARLFLARPSYVFLDEATTALEPDNERRLYEQLRASVKIVVSVGHRAMLSKYHSHVLELLGDGKWRIEKTDSGTKP